MTQVSKRRVRKLVVFLVISSLFLKKFSRMTSQEFFTVISPRPEYVIAGDHYHRPYEGSRKTKDMIERQPSRASRTGLRTINQRHRD